MGLERRGGVMSSGPRSPPLGGRGEGPGLHCRAVGGQVQRRHEVGTGRVEHTHPELVVLQFVERLPDPHAGGRAGCLRPGG